MTILFSKRINKPHGSFQGTQTAVFHPCKETIQCKLVIEILMLLPNYTVYITKCDAYNIHIHVHLFHFMHCIICTLGFQKAFNVHVPAILTM